jgi:hypothetical protein
MTVGFDVEFKKTMTTAATAALSMQRGHFIK